MQNSNAMFGPLSDFYTYHQFFSFVVIGSRYVALASLELLGSSDPPTSASQSVEITDVSHCAWPFSEILMK